MRPEPDFIHEFIPGDSPRTLLLLHGTGGNERDLIPLAQHYGFPTDRLVAVGYSNGANIAASMLLLRPELLPTATLFRAMVPLHPEKEPNLSSVRVWIGAGDQDPIVPASETKRLAELLRRVGADVTIHFAKAGHGLTNNELEAAGHWVGELKP